MQFKIYLVNILIWRMTLITKARTANVIKREFFRTTYLSSFYILSSLTSHVPPLCPLRLSYPFFVATIQLLKSSPWLWLNEIHKCHSFIYAKLVIMTIVLASETLKTPG